MNKVYLSGRYRHRADLIDKAAQLESEGFEITSRWLQSNYDDVSDSARAADDEDDVRRSDILVLFAESENVGERGGGGRHVEFGIAYALGKRIIVVGDRENVFHSLPGIKVVPDWPGATVVIRALRTPAGQ